jgi:hypothetical protein
LRKFPADSKLEAVRGIYSRKLLGLRQQAVVDVKFEHHPLTAVPIEVIGMLVPGSKFKDKKRIPPKDSQSRSISIDRVEEAVLLDHEYWHRVHSMDGSSCLIRSIELARVLFFHSPHLIRCALRPNGMDSLVRIGRGDEVIEVSFTEMADFPASQLHNKRIQSHLSWLFLSQSAKQSFGSIYQEWVMSDEERWMFRFSPPPMHGWQISVMRCAHSVDPFLEKVSEIRTVNVEDFCLQQKVIFRHPKLRYPVTLDESRKSRKRKPTDEHPELDLPSVPGMAEGMHQVDDGNLKFNIPSGPMTEVDGGLPRPEGSGTREAEAGISQSTGAGPSELDGDAQELSLRLNQEADPEEEQQPDELIASEPTGRFSNFEKAINILVHECNYELTGSIGCYEFPLPKTRSKKILRTEDGRPIQYYLAGLRCNDLSICILEADVESLLVHEEANPESVSTLLAIVRGEPTQSVSRIVQSFSDSGVTWKESDLRTHCLVFHRCDHPKRYRSVDTEVAGKITRQRVPRENDVFLRSWVDILQRGIQKITQKYNDAQKDSDIRE